MEFASGTLDLSDEELVSEITSLRLSNERFRHFDHIRLAWIFLRAEPLAEASDRMVATLRRFGFHIRGNYSRYHETVTRGFMRLVAAHIRMTPDIATFTDFARAHPQLLDKNALLAYYSDDCLNGEKARVEWVEPDLHPLP